MKARPDQIDDLIRTAERAAYARYGLAPRERIVELSTPRGPVAVRVTSFGPQHTEDPPVLVLHGIASVNVLAAQVIAALPKREVIAVDWPGHGLSGPDELPVGTVVRSYVTATLRALLDELRLREVDVVGHSMGAQFGLYAGLDMPDRIRRIVVLGAPGAAFAGIRPTPLMIALAVPGVGARLLRAPSSRKAFVRVSEKPLGGGALRGVPAELLTAAYLISRRPTYPRSVASYFRAMIRGRRVRPSAHVPNDELRSLRQPTLLAWGDEDIFLTPDEAATHIAALPNGKLLTLPGAGHAPWLQYPELVGCAVADHLTTAPQPDPTALDRPRARQEDTMSTEPTRVDFPSSGGISIAAYRWDPTGTPRAIVQITHGVGEHALRYAPIAAALTERGFVVFAHDHRGHGATSSAEQEYGVLGKTGWTELVSDIGRMGACAREQCPGLPLALVAHSMGSFATQQYLLDHSSDVDAVVLSGTAAVDLLEPMIDLDAPMDLSMFNAAFQPARTDFDWLSRDDAQVDAYLADPMCGFSLDVPGAKALFVGARGVADPDRVSAMRKDLPIYLVVGEMDPVNGQLALVYALIQRYQQAGLREVTLKTWPDARHEVFNEVNRNEVVADVITWLEHSLNLLRP